MQPLPCHTLSPFKHGFGARELGSIPVAFQYAPTSFYGIVLAVVRRIVEHLDGPVDGVDKLNHPLQKLGAHSAAPGTIVGFDLDEDRLFPLPGSESVPPRLEGVDNEITGFMGAAKGDVHPSGVLIQDSKGNIFLIAPHVVVASLVVAPRFSPSGVIANIDRGFAVQAHSLDVFRSEEPLFFLDIFEYLTFRSSLDAFSLFEKNDEI